jgi:hypothetical protein
MLSYKSRARRRPLALTLIALVALGTGCAQPSRFASTPTVSPSEAVMLVQPTRGSINLERDGRSPRNRISRSEVNQIPASTAYDVVRRLRPEFLHSSARRVAAGSHAVPVVYIDALASGSLSTLAMIPVQSVIDITYFPPVDAMVRFGPSHGAGAIVVRTHR